jgi:hypothetical protein
MSNNITLYSCEGTPNSIKITLTLEELGLKYAHQQCVKEIIKLINLLNFKIMISWFDYDYGFLKNLIWFDL